MSDSFIEVESVPQEPRPHHAHGPSGLKNKYICPGWVNDNSPRKDNEAADEGELMHHCCETGNIIGLDQEQEKCVRDCLDRVAILEADAFSVLKEVRLSILGGLTFGTADRVILVKRGDRWIAHIVDFKFGRAYVDPAEHNIQGWCYVLGVFEKFPDVEEVIVHFMIPRRDEYTSHTFTRGEDFMRLETAIRTIIARAEEYRKTENAELLNPVESNCVYCGRLGVSCAKTTSLALAVGKEYAPLEIVDEVHSSKITDPNKMARAYALARVMEKWAESVKKHAMDMVREGYSIPGYEVRERASPRSITNTVLALPILQQHFSIEEIMDCAKLSASQLEKALSARTEKAERSAKLAELYSALSDAECVKQGEPIRYLQKSRE